VLLDSFRPVIPIFPWYQNWWFPQSPARHLRVNIMGHIHLWAFHGVRSLALIKRMRPTIRSSPSTMGPCVSCVQPCWRIAERNKNGLGHYGTRSVENYKWQWSYFALHECMKWPCTNVQIAGLYSADNNACLYFLVPPRAESMSKFAH